MRRAQWRSNLSALEVLEMCTPQEEDFVPDFATRIAARLSITPHQATAMAMDAYQLSLCPNLAKVVRTGYYPITMVRKILSLIATVTEPHLTDVESDICAMLRPSHPNQQLPTTKGMTYRIKKIIEKHQPIARPLDEGEERKTNGSVRHAGPEISFDQSNDARTRVLIDLPKLDGIELEKLVRAAAAKYECTQAEAFLRIVREHTDVRITLNLYKNTADPTEDLFAEGSWLPKAVGEEWMPRITHLAAPGFAEAQGYAPTEAIKAALAGRDGGCRAPHCSVPPHRCDVDHVRRYDHEDPAAGGPTNTDNLHLLCRYHHKQKTAGQWDVELRPDGSEAWTSVGDGHQVVTVPHGPLGRETFQFRHLRRAKAVKLHNLLTIMPPEGEPTLDLHLAVATVQTEELDLDFEETLPF